MTEHDDEQCEGCQDSDRPHDECGYNNEDCPEFCTTEHDIGIREMECPEAGTEWVNCDDCGWTPRSRYSNPVTFNGMFLCDVESHGLSYCDGCGDLHDQDDLYYDERNGDGYLCESCNSHSCRSAEPARRFVCCSSHDVHLHLLTEQFLCDCRALAAHAKGEPVDFHGDPPVHRLLRPLLVAA